MQILAHRGSSGTAPENTLSAFKKALLDGCDGFELDVQQTKDGKIVVFHDWTLERTTDGVGNLKNHTLSELKKLDAGSWFSDSFKGEQIPTLEEILDITPDDKFINIELKEEFSKERGTEKLVVDILKRYPKKNFLISSFSHNLLKNIKKIDKNIKVGILVEASLVNLENYIKNLGFEISAYNPGKSFIKKEDIEFLKREKIDINIWTVNSKTEYDFFKNIGVTRIITNYPESF